MIRLGPLLFGIAGRQGGERTLEPPVATPVPAAPPFSPPVKCPRCTLVGFEDRGPIVVPRYDGSRDEVGRLYGCPHCGLAFFTQDGDVRKFGYYKAQLDAHPDKFVPPPGAIASTSGEDEERAKVDLGIDFDLRSRPGPRRR